MITEKLKKNKGVSTLGLVITIIVMLILAGIVLASQRNHFSEASRSVFVQELKDVETQASSKRLNNQVYGTTEAIKNQGFYKAYVKNPPENFESFSEDTIYGYVVDLKYIKYEDNKRGHAYVNYTGDPENNNVEFGKDDVYIYDAKGTMFYAKGFEIDGGTYYDAETLEEVGPIIKSIEIVPSADKKSAVITIGVEKISTGTISLRFNDESIAPSSDGAITYFNVTVYENKTYKIIAEESGAGKTSSSVEVTSIEAETYTVTYDANGGSDAPDPQTKTENITMRLSTRIPTREKYTFLGWHTDSNATNAMYKAGSEFIANQDTTLYAIWQDAARTYTVRYSANGGYGAPTDVFEGKVNFVVTDVIPTREGYGFNGWSADPQAISGDEQYAPGRVATLDKNLILYATWLVGGKTIKVTASPSGDAGIVTGNGSRVAGSTVLITATAKEGWKFKDWSVIKGGVQLASAVSSSTTFKMPYKDVEIVANFTKSNLTLRYNSNKGTDAPSPQTGKFDDILTLSNKIPTRAGYDFLGWSIDPNAETAEYNPGDPYTLKNSAVLYAVWEKKQEFVKITYNLNGGTGDFPEQEVEKGLPIILHSDIPSLTSMQFLGWSNVPNLFECQPSHSDVVYTAGETCERNSDLTLYAVWKDEVVPTITLTAEYDGNNAKLTANLFDEGCIAAYAWTTSAEVPTSWLTDNTYSKNITTVKELDEKGTYYIFAKDHAGNVSSQNITIYEVKYNVTEGEGTIPKQLKIPGQVLTITMEEPTMTTKSFLGWTKVAGDFSNLYQPGDSFNDDADTELKAAWGDADFTLSIYEATTSIDEPDINVTITPREYTGTITVTSSNSDVATGVINGTTLIVKLGQTPGEAILTLTESTKRISHDFKLTLNKADRNIQLIDTKIFTYGDDSGTCSYSYKGQPAEGDITLTNSNTSVVTSTIDKTNKIITLTPKKAGAADITLKIAENGQYNLESKKLVVTVNRKSIKDSTISITNVETSMEYTGLPVTQNPTIKDTKLNQTLNNGTDYTLSYLNNVEEFSTATMIVTGTGNYKDEVRFTYIVGCLHLNAPAATCTEVSYCDECDTIVAPALGHDYGEWVIINDSTCTATGLRRQTCSRCGNKNNETIPKKNHTPGNDATCTTPQTCTVCGTVLVGAFGHTPGEAATCTTAQKCTVCGTTIVSVLGHQLTNRITNTVATCVSAGSATDYCTRAGCSYSEEVDLPIDSSNHDYDNGVVTREATCSLVGIRTYTCRRSSTHTYNAEIATVPHNPGAEATCTEDQTCTMCDMIINPALGHDMQLISYSEATCTSEGHRREECTRCDYYTNETYDKLPHNPGANATCTEDQYCTVCGTLIQAATGHTEETMNGYDATCTEDGLTDGKKCSVCGTILESQSVIPATGHTEQTVYGYAATCTETGLKDGTKCSVCGITLIARETIPANGHSYTLACNQGCGATNVRCSVCGAVLEHDCHKHSYTWGITKAATCTEKGVKTYTCTCGDSYTEPIDKIEHSYSITKSATCVNTGVETCSMCGGTTSTAKNPDNHEGPMYGEIAKEATCIATGLINYICDACNNVESSSTVERRDHSYTETTAATCSRTGIKTCSVCKGTATVAKDSNNHEGVVENELISAATCTEKGSYKEKCSGCGVALQTVVVPAKGHTEQTTEGYAATCTKEGLTDKITCSVCGITIQGATSIDKIDHNMQWKSTDAVGTCSTAAKFTYECSMCSQTETRYGGKNSSNHESISSWTSKDSTTHIKKCTACGVETSSGSHGSWGGYSPTAYMYHKKSCGTCGYTITQEACNIVNEGSVRKCSLCTRVY